MDDPNGYWTQPSGWENYSGGVIGSFGFAWWATDDEVPPYDTGGGPYNETKALMKLLQSLLQSVILIKLRVVPLSVD